MESDQKLMKSSKNLRWDVTCLHNEFMEIHELKYFWKMKINMEQYLNDFCSLRTPQLVQKL